MESSLQTMITSSKRDYEYSLIKNSSHDKMEGFGTLNLLPQNTILPILFSGTVRILQN